MENKLYGTDAELVTGLKNNDRKAYEQFYDKYGPTIYDLIYQLVAKEDIANVVMIETFLQLQKEIGTYQDIECSILYFALEISRNVARQHLEDIIIAPE